MGLLAYNRWKVSTCTVWFNHYLTIHYSLGYDSHKNFFTYDGGRAPMSPLWYATAAISPPSHTGYPCRSVLIKIFTARVCRVVMRSVASVCLSVCLSVCVLSLCLLSVCLSAVCLSVCLLSVCLSVCLSALCLSVCLSVFILLWLQLLKALS